MVVVSVGTRQRSRVKSCTEGSKLAGVCRSCLVTGMSAQQNQPQQSVAAASAATATTATAAATTAAAAAAATAAATSAAAVVLGCPSPQTPTRGNAHS